MKVLSTASAVATFVPCLAAERDLADVAEAEAVLGSAAQRPFRAEGRRLEGTAAVREAGVVELLIFGVEIAHLAVEQQAGDGVQAASSSAPRILSLPAFSTENSGVAKCRGRDRQCADAGLEILIVAVENGGVQASADRRCGS